MEPRESLLTLDDTIPSKEVILKARSSHKRVILNVGGIRHEVMWKMLEQVRERRCIVCCIQSSS